jgi:hypothetical protein
MFRKLTKLQSKQNVKFDFSAFGLTILDLG